MDCDGVGGVDLGGACGDEYSAVGAGGVGEGLKGVGAGGLGVNE